MQKSQKGMKRGMMLSLFDLGHWEKELANDLKPLVCYKEVISGIPSLQRGLVWKADQIELLWDSILRGFPIGSLTGMEIPRQSNQLEQQVKSHGERSAEDATHYLLDGQQRAHAVALAFYDPLEDWESVSFEQKERLEKRSYLWIDLDYQTKESASRSYLFRLVTPSHQWGYKKSDSSVLKHDKIAKHLENIGVFPEQRLYAYESFPADADFPVPFAWVIEFAFKKDGGSFETFLEKKQKSYEDHAYVAYMREKLSQKGGIDYERVIKPVQKLENYRLPFLLLETEQIEDMQELFERLNRNGTQVSELDLFYSAFKAYFPGIEAIIEKVAAELMIHEAYVCVSAFRLLHSNEGKFISGEPNAKAVTSKKLDHNKVKDFFKEKLDEIKEEILSLVMSDEEDFGLPKAALTYIVKDSRVVLYLLFWIAYQKPKKWFENCRKALIALIMIIDTFGVKKDEAVKRVMDVLNKCEEETDCDCFKGIVPKLYSLDQGKKGVEKIYSPHELDQILVIPDSEDKAKEIKSLWDFVVFEPESIDDETPRVKERDERWGFVNRIHRLRYADTILLYAQRQYYERKFKDFADFSYFWQAHNRPWDYDHILPASVLYNKRNITFKKFADPWVWNIGNYRILHFSDNRSRQNELLDQKMIERNLFLLPEEDEEFNSFRLKTDNFNQFEDAVSFIKASKNRLIRIYGKWWEDLEVENLVESKKSK